MTAAVAEAWAIFQRRYCRMESPAVFSCTEFCRPPQETVLPADPDEDRCIRITAFVCDMADAAEREYGSSCDSGIWICKRIADSTDPRCDLHCAREKQTGWGWNLVIFRITRIKME